MKFAVRHEKGWNPTDHSEVECVITFSRTESPFSYLFCSLQSFFKIAISHFKKQYQAVCAWFSSTCIDLHLPFLIDPGILERATFRPCSVQGHEQGNFAACLTKSKLIVTSSQLSQKHLGDRDKFSYACHLDLAQYKQIWTRIWVWSIPQFHNFFWVAPQCEALYLTAKDHRSSSGPETSLLSNHGLVVLLFWTFICRALNDKGKKWLNNVQLFWNFQSFESFKAM